MSTKENRLWKNSERKKLCLDENSLDCIEMDESGDIFFNPKYGKKLIKH